MSDDNKTEPENKQSESEIKISKNDIKDTENKDKNPSKKTDSTSDTKPKSSKKEDNKEPPVITDEETIKHKKRDDKRKEYNRRYYAQRKNKIAIGEVIPKDTTDKVKEKTKKDNGISPVKIALGLIGFVVSVILILMFIGHKSGNNENSGNSSFTIKRE